MRLIDADTLITKIWELHKETEKAYDLCVDELKDVYCGIVSLIDEHPTAYDVDMVVKQLETLPVCSTWNHNSDNISRNNAIEIVKAGGTGK